MMRGTSVLFLIALGSLLSGCAVDVPSIGDIGQPRKDIEVRESDLVDHVRCEIRLAVQRLEEEIALNQGPLAGNSIEWLKGWGAKVNLQVQVLAKSTASPSLSVTDPLENVIKVFPENGNMTVSRNNAFGIGGTLGSEITRTETMGYFYAFADLTGRTGLKDRSGATPDHARFCGPIELTENDDLQIYDFLHRKVLLAAKPSTLPNATKGPYDVLSFQVKFIVTQGATFNPTWKLARVAIGPSGTFYAGQRVRTHDLTITMGPVKKEGTETVATLSLNEQHLANLIGRAVADAIRDQP